MASDTRREAVVSEEGGDGPQPLWTWTWTGAHRMDVNGLPGRAMPDTVTVSVFVPGNWIVCGGDGCLVLRTEDIETLRMLALCLLGRDLPVESSP